MSEESKEIKIEETTDNISDVRWIDTPVISIFVILILLVASQFFTRYVLNDSLSWTEEISRYFLIFLGFVGSVTCVRKRSHIYLEFFYRYLPEKKIKPLVLFCELITASFFGYLGYLGIFLIEKTKVQSMVSINLPKSIIYYVVMFSCFLMAIIAFYRIFQLIQTHHSVIANKQLNKHEHKEV